MYQPTKEHLDTQIPDAFRGINEILRELKKETGADDRYVSLMLEVLAKQWEPQAFRTEGFGFH